MSTILYARSVLSPKSMLVWLMMMELPRSGVALPEDDTLLARLCMTTPRGLVKARAEIMAAGLSDVSDDDLTPEIKTSKTDKSVLKAERNRRYYENKRLKTSYSDGGGCLNSDVQGGIGNTERGSSLSLEVSPAPLPKPNPILPKEGIYPAHEGLEITTTPLAEPIPLEPDIIPPDLSDIRGAVAGMLAGVLVPMSETTPKSEITEVANAENPSRSATPVPPCRTDASPVASPRGSRKDYDVGFTEFWAHYPRQKGHDKASAAAKYATTLKIASHDEIMRQLRGYLAHLADNAWKQPQHPATWLNKTFVRNAEEPLDWTAPDPVPSGGDAGPSVMRPGKRASLDPVEAAFAEQMAEIEARERESQHVH